MAQTQILEGRWEEIVARDGDQLAGRRGKVFIEPHEIAPVNSSLDAAIDRLNSRTPEEIAAARTRVLHTSPEPLPTPEGRTLLDMIMGKWPGDEADEEIREALRKLS